MKRLTYIILILFLVLASILLTGCSKRESETDKMIAYLNEKYDDEFEYSPSFGASKDSKMFKSKKYPEANIWVTYNASGDYSDNYVTYKFESQTRELLQSKLKEIYMGEASLFNGLAGFGHRETLNDYTRETAFEEYILNERLFFNAVVLVDNPQNAATKSQDTLKNLFVSEKLIADGQIYFTDDKDIFEKLKSNQLSQRELNKLTKIIFLMDEDTSFKKFEITYPEA